MKIVENRKEAAAKDNRSIVLKSYSTVIILDFDGYWNINSVKSRVLSRLV